MSYLFVSIKINFDLKCSQASARFAAGRRSTPTRHGPTTLLAQAGPPAGAQLTESGRRLARSKLLAS